MIVTLRSEKNSSGDALMILGVKKSENGERTEWQQLQWMLQWMRDWDSSINFC